MFVRFRQTKHRLQLSLVETRRADGKVQHEHVASLGSVKVPLTVQGRLAFWQKLHERLASLSNRVDAATAAKIRDKVADILGKVHERIAMVTLEEQAAERRALQLANAEADARFWATMQGMNEEQTAGNKGVIAQAERQVAAFQSAATTAAGRAAIARERIERLQRGEDLEGGLGKPMTGKDMERMLREQGWTDSDFRHAEHLSELERMGATDEYLDACSKADARTERIIARRMVRERQ